MTETPKGDGGLPQAAIAALRKGKTIEAIKIVRQERGLGLKEAKDAVDDYLRHDPILQRSLRQAQEEARRGCVPWVLALIALAALVYYLVTGN
jgi:hypothetical protein